MRILFMINLYPPYIVGGNEMITHSLVKTLRDAGHDVHVLTARGQQLDDVPYVHQVFNYSLDDKEAIFQGGRRLSLLELLHHHVFDPATYRQVRRVATKLQPDLIVADNLYMASAAPLLAVRDIACPIIVQAMDKWLTYTLIDWGQIVKPALFHQKLCVATVRKLVQQPIARRVRLDGIATVSEFVRNYYISAGFRPEMLRAVYLGYDQKVFYPGPLHPLSEPVQLLFVGSLWKGKGPQTIVRALEILGSMEGLPPFELNICGEGGLRFRRYLDQVIHETGTERQVVFHGFMPWDRLVETMHKSDIFVFSSIWDEPFATVPLQASGCGLPVVATTAGGTPEGFVDAVTALLIPPDDAHAMAEAIARLVRNDNLRIALRENGIRAAKEHWTFQAYVDRFLRFCGDVSKQWEQEHL